jgi:hypothetical protein
VKFGVLVVGAMLVLGAALGALWAWWSPPGPIGLVISPGAIQPDETEAFVAGDGRYAVLVLLAGLGAGLVAWFRRSRRGPLVPIALALGGLGGAYLTALVGNLLGGGSDKGPANTLLKQLPLTLHLQGLVFLEAGAAVFCYLVCTGFAARDDLGRPSVAVGGELQDPGADRDAAGGLEQAQFPAQ